MKVIAISVEQNSLQDDPEKQVYLSVQVNKKTTYRQVYADLWQAWEAEEVASPMTSTTTNEEMDAMFRAGVAALKRRDAAILDTPIYPSLPPEEQRSQLANFVATYVTDED